MFKCDVCAFETAKRSGLDRHTKSRRHLALAAKKACSTCGKTYHSSSGLWKHAKQCGKEEALRTLLRQQEALVQQLQHTAQHHVHHHVHHHKIMVFLNEQCRNAVNWPDFVAGLTIDLGDDMTESILKTVCAGMRGLGVHERPIHCVDAKKRQLYLKSNDIWENDAEKIKTMLRTSNQVLQNQCRLSLLRWDDVHPNWDLDDVQSERFRKLALQLTEGVDEEKYVHELSKQFGIKP
jgi:hypothetical protein